MVLPVGYPGSHIAAVGEYEADTAEQSSQQPRDQHEPHRQASHHSVVPAHNSQGQMWNQQSVFVFIWGLRVPSEVLGLGGVG